MDRRKMRQDMYRTATQAVASGDMNSYRLICECLQKIHSDLTSPVKPLPPPPPSFVLQPYMKMQVNKGLECPILSIPLQDCNEVTMLSCYHMFDSESITKWLQTKPSCPTCRCEKPTVLLTMKTVFG
jgi:hypothetical protein